MTSVGEPESGQKSAAVARKFNFPHTLDLILDGWGRAWPERCQVTLPRLEILADSRKSLARRIRRPPFVSNEVERWREEERLRKVANHLGLGRRSRGRA